jgi:hypothetical protein
MGITTTDMITDDDRITDVIKFSDGLGAGHPNWVVQTCQDQTSTRLVHPRNPDEDPTPVDTWLVGSYKFPPRRNPPASGLANYNYHYVSRLEFTYTVGLTELSPDHVYVMVVLVARKDGLFQRLVKSLYTGWVSALPIHNAEIGKPNRFLCVRTNPYVTDVGYDSIVSLQGEEYLTMDILVQDFIPEGYSMVVTPVNLDESSLLLTYTDGYTK